VFAITQVVGLLHHGITWTTLGQAVLVFWLVWWAWTQFTWTLNAADTTHHLVVIPALVATGIAFFMSVALPDAFHGRELAFAIPYVAVRVVGLTLHVAVSWTDVAQRSAVFRFGTASIGGLIAVILGAIIGGDMQYWLWGVAVLLDIVAALIGGAQGGWNVHPEHFSERHALFVIIALGETLIVAAAGLSGTEWNSTLLYAAVLSVLVTFGYWWSYFTIAKPQLDSALEGMAGVQLTKAARDVFSIVHFPMLFGVVMLAVVTSEVLGHPGEPLTTALRFALAGSVLLFIGGMALAVMRATGRLLLPRVLVVIATSITVLLMADVNPLHSVSVAAIGIVLALSAEHVVEARRLVTRR
jgi:low temperature requirement protein LtrA